MSIINELRQAYENVAIINQGKQWELYECEYYDYAEIKKIKFIFFDSDANNTSLDDALEKNSHERKLNILIQNSSPLISGKNSSKIQMKLESIKKSLSATTIRTVRQFSFDIIKRNIDKSLFENLNEPKYTSQALIYFRHDSHEESKDNALNYFINEWLINGKRNVAVILGAGGGGKTRLCEKINFNYAINFENRQILPIFIDSSQWKNLLDKSPIAIEDILSESLVQLKFKRQSTEFLETFLNNGSFLIIFDGFDELCTMFYHSFNAQDVLEKITSLVSGLNKTIDTGRILLTTRDVFWDEAIKDVKSSEVMQLIEKNIDIFALKDFNEKQMIDFIQSSPDLTNEIQRKRAEKLARSVIDAYDNKSKIEINPYMLEMICLAAEDTNNAELSVSNLGIMYAVLKKVCDRNSLKQGIGLDSTTQMEIFKNIVKDREYIGNSFSEDFIWIYSNIDKENPKDKNRFRSFISHPLIKKNKQNNYEFRWNFAGPFFECLVFYDILFQEEISEYEYLKKFSEKLHSGLTEYFGNLNEIFRLNKINNLEYKALINRIKILSDKLRGHKDWRNYYSPALFNLIQYLSTNFKSTERKSEDIIEDILFVFDGKFENMSIKGTITKINLFNVTFINCNFKDVVFDKCDFNENTLFENGEFTGRIEFKNCKGLKRLSFKKNFSKVEKIDEDSKACLMKILAENEVPVYEDDVKKWINQILGKFRTGKVYHSVKKINIIIGCIKNIPKIEKIFEEFIKLQIITLDQKTISTKDENILYKINVNYMNIVSSFLDNNKISGPLNNIYSYIFKLIND